MPPSFLKASESGGWTTGVPTAAFPASIRSQRKPEGPEGEAGKVLSPRVPEGERAASLPLSLPLSLQSPKNQSLPPLPLLLPLSVKLLAAPPLPPSPPLPPPLPLPLPGAVVGSVSALLALECCRSMRSDGWSLISILHTRREERVIEGVSSTDRSCGRQAGGRRHRRQEARRHRRQMQQDPAGSDSEGPY